MIQSLVVCCGNNKNVLLLKDFGLHNNVEMLFENKAIFNSNCSLTISVGATFMLTLTIIIS